jgi:hypothetical protein
MTKVVWGAKAACVVALAVAASSCGKLTREGTSSSYLVLTSLQGARGLATTFSSVLQSDVLNVDPQTGAQSIAADQGQAVFQLALKDPGSSTTPNTPTPNNYTIARVTFYGHDQTGREVSVTGNIEVDFSDWAG